MGEAHKILRNSIYTFFHGYHSFISISSLFVFPFSASLLLSQSLITSSPSSLQFISSRIRTLFLSASFPVSSPLFSLLNLMLSQTIFSSILSLPFTLTFLLLAKASIILIIRNFPHLKVSPPTFKSLLNLFTPLLSTHLFTSFLLLSAHASIFTLLFLTFNAAEFVGLSSTNSLIVLSSAAAILYSIVIANTVVVCNLAIIVSGIEKCGGYLSVLKACVLIRGRVATALSVTLPTNLTMAGIEALFQYRVMRTYYLSTSFNPSIVWEAFTIVYIHSILMVVEIIASCLFYKSCRVSCKERWEGEFGYNYQIELEPEEKSQV